MTPPSKSLRVVLTGATGMVGEGVLLECLANPAVEHVLVLGRRACGHTHAKLTEVLVPDFFSLQNIEAQLAGFNACFYCAGISSAGMSEADYTRVTYDTPLHVAQTLVRLNPQMVMCHVSGSHTDGTEQGRVMWARVKGRAENALMKLPFAGVFNFRPGLMKPTEGQHNVKTLFRVLLVLTPVMALFFPACTIREVALAMIHVATRGASKQVLEVADLRALAVA